MHFDCCISPEYFTSRYATWIFVTQGESYSVQCRDAGEFSGPELISDAPQHSGNVCCGQISPRLSMLLGKMDNEFSDPRWKWPSRQGWLTLMHGQQQRGFVDAHHRRRDVLVCLSCSPELSPFENVWPIKKRRIRQWQPRLLSSCLVSGEIE